MGEQLMQNVAVMHSWQFLQALFERYQQDATSLLSHPVLTRVMLPCPALHAACCMWVCCNSALATRSAQQQQPAAELVVAAGSAVRPLFSIAENALQLLPLALMRRCMLAVA
jgi:hypothetical protein